MAFSDFEQGSRRAAWLASSLLPFLQGAYSTSIISS